MLDEEQNVFSSKTKMRHVLVSNTKCKPVSLQDNSTGGL